jgi:subtilisin family serine protease
VTHRRNRLRIRAIAAAAGIATVTSLVALTGTAAARATTSQTASTYLVLYRGGASTADAKSTIEAAGGNLVANYSAIGVVIARSTNSGFLGAVRANSKVEGAAATGNLGSSVTGGAADSAAGASASPALAAWGDTLSNRQWDMTQIHAPEAQAINPGSSTVVVGDLDTGLDFTHPDLAPNYDAVDSTDCTSGTPAPLLAGNDKNGHGTHTAGTIAAAANGTGIVGVAPGVKIAGVKTGNDDGFFFPEAVVCAYMWVGNHGIDITNNSYFADPWLYNCKNDADQRAIWNAERRAIRYAQSKGTLVIASEGNESTDLSHPEIDNISPDDTTPVTREVTNACAVVPVEVPGVVGVTATSNRSQKSFYSSYGISTADVAAPGGDSLFFDRSADVPNGRVLSTWPADDFCLADRTVFDPTTGAKYCYLQGTSMAGPHAVGVAALLKSAHGYRAGALAAALQQATNSVACPTDMSNYVGFPQLSGAPQACSGGATHNSFYGSGEVDALKAVS